MHSVSTCFCSLAPLDYTHQMAPRLLAAALRWWCCGVVLSCSVPQGCKVTEIRDMNSLWGALEKCLYDGANVIPEVRMRMPFFFGV